MPLYEYRCQSCSSHIEVMQRFSDPPLATCDECGGELKKLLSAPAFQFKGDGWYVTDYARKDAKGKDKKAKSAGGKETKDKGDKPAKDAGEKKTGGSSKDSGAKSSK